MEIKFNKITMKDGAINIEEDKNLTKMLTESMSNHAEFTKTKRERAMELDSHWYLTPDSNEFSYQGLVGNINPADIIIHWDAFLEEVETTGIQTIT